MDRSLQEDGGVPVLLIETLFFILSLVLARIRGGGENEVFSSFASFCSSWSIFFDWSLFCVFKSFITSMLWFKSWPSLCSQLITFVILSFWSLKLLLICVLISSIFTPNSASNWFNWEANPTGCPVRAYSKYVDIFFYYFKN